MGNISKNPLKALRSRLKLAAHKNEKAKRLKIILSSIGGSTVKCSDRTYSVNPSTGVWRRNETKDEIVANRKNKDAKLDSQS